MSTARRRLQEAAHLARRGWPIHPLDVGYAAFSSWKFTEGWGDEAVLRPFEAGDPFALRPGALHATYGEWMPSRRGGRWRDGTFASPVAELTGPVALGHVRHLSHARVPRRAAVVVLSGSGEEGYDLRTGVHGPLVEEGIDLYFLESPYYGQRRAVGQVGSEVPRVSDQALMNKGMIAEAEGFLLGLAAEDPHLPLGIAGFSMGAYMATQVAVRFPHPLAMVSLAGGDSARDIYTLGLLSLSIDFAKLGNGDAAAARERLGSFYHRARASLLPLPRRPDAAVILGARRDGYVPLAESQALHQHWKGSALHVIGGGHISAVVLARRAMRRAVLEAFARLAA